MTEQSSGPAPFGVRPENVAVLVMAALAVGLLVGVAIGQRQGMVVKQVVLPEAGPGAGFEADLAATAPAAPTSVAEARAMVAAMGHSDPETLIGLGDRKLANQVTYLALGFYLAALDTAPDRAEVWVKVAGAYRQVGQSADALEAARQATSRRPDLAEAWYEQAAAAAALGRQDQAATAAARYLALAPEGEHAAEARRWR